MIFLAGTTIQNKALYWYEQPALNKYTVFLNAGSGDDDATDLTSVKNKTINEETTSQTRSEPTTEEPMADENLGASKESDTFTDKMVSGDSEALIRPITAALRMCLLCVTVNPSERF